MQKFINAQNAQFQIVSNLTPVIKRISPNAKNAMNK